MCGNSVIENATPICSLPFKAIIALYWLETGSDKLFTYKEYR